MAGDFEKFSDSGLVPRFKIDVDMRIFIFRNGFICKSNEKADKRLYEIKI